MSLLAGTTDTDAPRNTSYGWQLSLSQPFGSYAAASLGWINEGHVPAHRRDGLTGQIWLQTPLWYRLRIAGGVGPYVYFDTEPDVNEHGYIDHHGVGAVASAMLLYQTDSPWTLHLNFNRIHTTDDYDTHSLMLGVGYQLGWGEQSSAPPATGHHLPEGPQAQLFFGQATLNSLDVRRSASYGLDVQSSTFLHWMSAAATYFHDPQVHHSPQDRVAAQLRTEKQFDDSRLSLGMGLGVYATVGSASGNGSTNSNPEGLLLLRAGWQTSRHTELVASWYRSFTEDDRDLDIITLGLAWHFGLSD